MKSPNSSATSVNSYGVITKQGTGTTTIIASAFNNVIQAYCTVQVT